MELHKLTGHWPDLTVNLFYVKHLTNERVVDPPTSLMMAEGNATQERIDFILHCNRTFVLTKDG